ncbi:uncharacterized protein LACBIDRAFT_309409 [Laccaria bicolor S238N-H82]|uniref:diacylglycerol O-acyltransferase n=1 Tax=Laccaria bicolor (strain S238N-H82 / ATCC MYA-4686) TaxID=486041 RepID=B0DS85_LACBS|nr:uncharacterized protein LACBIDRAFT_309409 [Laccaria bicolor S238N-H82]EDR02428.1 predicted protein [Laccaria bicolor S238N-H82]|eukprot:XP_001886791.1 predicted protein [Laccaria bicolor S238N-H82]
MQTLVDATTLPFNVGSNFLQIINLFLKVCMWNNEREEGIMTIPLMRVEADLPADRSYVFECYPHVKCMCPAWRLSTHIHSLLVTNRDALAIFAAEATEFSAAFPGIKPYLLMLVLNFQVPFYRDILMCHWQCCI